MGYVICCHSAQRGGADAAWKLPRLIADTQRENAYIAQLMEGERSNVCRIGNRANQLIRYHAIDNPLEIATIGVRPIDVDPSTCPANQRVLVRFSKGKRPRFCGVQLLPDGELRVTPEGTLRMSSDEWERLARFLSVDAQGNGRFAPVFLADPRPEPGARARSTAYVNVEPSLLSQVVETETARRGWYIGLPTILYDWANGTLQDAISNRRRKDWTTMQHLMLVERVLSGLLTLHRAGMLHGDVRPANIMYVNDPNDPESFIMIDAGSLASGNSNIVGEGQAEYGVDKTILGAIANARASTFYAPERRQAFEHEDGDIAIIALDPHGSGSLIVAIGWRSRIEDRHGQAGERPSFAAQVEALLDLWIAALEQPRAFGAVDADARLCAGDRLRLREYVFDVLEPPVAVDGFAVMRCKPTVAKVWNERLVVPLLDFWREFNPTGVGNGQVVCMALPKVVEIYQWSQATDLFSIGVLLLYSIYGQDHRDATESDDERVAAPRVEREFTELLDTLANPLYFSRMWPHIERVCAALERIVEDHPEYSAKEFVAARSGIDNVAAKQDLREGTNGATEPDSIYKAALNIVQHITQTAPHARKLAVHGFGGNLAEFLLFIHFVFSCLHRRADLSKYDSGPERTPGREFPFSQDRTARDPQATERALQRARRLRELYVRGIFQDMRARLVDLPDYRPVSQAELILSLTKLEEELQGERNALRDEQQRRSALLQEQGSGLRIGPFHIQWRRRPRALPRGKESRVG